ncbi:acyclic terpene utilization AtuA family protein [Thermopolyspora sp. NPDC052614]|uniref:acyclic terpene utilization AtuA family protein n=1 Tax=Thermopolyspora sp. NPDC052614 TaxID=3155682 RepID=UPI0034394052
MNATTPDREPVRIYVPQGSLGVGLFPEEIDHALAHAPHAIALDAGSTDAGAAYLATGMSKNDRGSVTKDLGLLMEARERAGIPLLIGTSGQAGGDLNVDWTRDIVLEIAREKGYTPKIAVLYSEQDPDVIKRKLAEGRISSLPPLGDLDEATIDQCVHIVALMGPEPYFAALEAGADIVIGGRTSDPAVIGAFALWKGAPAGPTWHAGKIAECGGQATTANTGQRGVILEIDADGFEVEPVDPRFKATVESIAGHLLYENKNPWRLTEPGGELDVTECEYVQVTESRVRVTGSKWIARPYTMKLEGASADLFQTIMIIGIADPDVLAEPQAFHDMMLARLTERAISATGLSRDDFHISLRMYGWNGVSGTTPPPGSVPLEIGMMCVITAKTQELASHIAKACNPYFFHMPLRLGMELPSYGWPFTPGDIDRGPVYRFLLNHVVSVDDPLELVRIEMLDDLKAKVAADA